MNAKMNYNVYDIPNFCHKECWNSNGNYPNAKKRLSRTIKRRSEQKFKRQVRKYIG